MQEAFCFERRQMSLELAQQSRKQRGDRSLDLAIIAVLDKLDDSAVHLSNADRVGPEARHKLAGILKKYAKSAHPFADCVRDNRKRFGAKTEGVCATLKDIIRGTTKWRGHKSMDKGSPGVKGLSQCEVVDQDVFDLLALYSRLDVKKILELEA
jgi:hypothetical protein